MCKCEDNSLGKIVSLEGDKALTETIFLSCITETLLPFTMIAKIIDLS